MSSGKIKAGEGTLIGNAGEHYVMAELLKRGVIAALAPRNAPAFDILATRGEKAVRIRVKTKSEEYDYWQWNVKKDGAIFRHLSTQSDFIVLVNLTNETKDLSFYIARTTDVDGWLKADFDRWLNTPGKKGQKRAATNPKRHLGYSKYKGELKSDWDVLWT